MRSYHILSLTLLCCSAFLGTQRVSAAPAPAPGRSGSSAAASDGIGRLRITSNSLSCTSSSLLETADGDTPRGRFRADRISINWDRLNIRGDANMTVWYSTRRLPAKQQLLLTESFAGETSATFIYNEKRKKKGFVYHLTSESLDVDTLNRSRLPDDAVKIWFQVSGRSPEMGMLSYIQGVDIKKCRARKAIAAGKGKSDDAQENRY